MVASSLSSILVANSGHLPLHSRLVQHFLCLSCIEIPANATLASASTCVRGAGVHRALLYIWEPVKSSRLPDRC
jgi:hypothetical protein